MSAANRTTTPSPDGAPAGRGARRQLSRMLATLFATAAVFLLAIVAISVLNSGRHVITIGDSAAGSVPLSDIDHSGWDQLLQKYVDADGMVNYRAWHDSAEDLERLADYLSSLSAADLSSGSKEEQLAFWINAYNALTVYGILREYPTDSIRRHTSVVGGYNIWKHLQLFVGGRAWSLEQIEHEILRPLDPRIHFAIVCASVGCPRLLNRAWLPPLIDEQLESNARDFFSRPRNFRFDERRQVIYLSELLKWYGEDFGRTRQQQLKTIARWFPSENARTAAEKGTVRVEFLPYDWRLNERKP